MKGLGIGNERLQHNILDLFHWSKQMKPSGWMDVNTHTHTHTHTHYARISKKLVIARLPHTIWPIFSLFLIFCLYLTRIKALQISQQNKILIKYWLFCTENCVITNAYWSVSGNQANRPVRALLISVSLIIIGIQH